MFAKLARFQMFDRIAGRRFGAVACNDNPPLHRAAAASDSVLSLAQGSIWRARMRLAYGSDFRDQSGRTGHNSAAHPSQRARIAVASALHLLL
jgi:hypothetical protein